MRYETIMDTKRFWARSVDDRRARRARIRPTSTRVELAGGSRYLRRVGTFRATACCWSSPLGDEKPGQIVDLELPRRSAGEPVRVKFEVVYVTAGGQVGVRGELASTSPLRAEALSGRESL